ncbi:hypothetical protein BGZ76_010931 [Entomortierella beljakovae]|nr:hypothetical protein BGZ76_010931 [Entomortierella beljakovae]
MGILNPICTASDGVKIYGLAFAPSYSDPLSSYNILIKSEDYPSETVQYMTWTLISQIPRQGLYYLRDENIDGLEYTCTVDSNGVFTALTRYSSISKDAPMENVVRGLQYQPGLPGSDGVWRNIDVAQPFIWPEFVQSKLYNLKDPITNKTTLMHAAITKTNTTNTIAVAAMDPNTFTTEFINYETLLRIDLSNGSTSLPTSPGAVTAFEMNVNGCEEYDDRMLGWKDKLIIICEDTHDYISSELVRFDGSSFLPDSYRGRLDNVRTMVALQGAVNSFLFAYNSSGVYSIQVDGDSTLQMYASSTRISITDQFGINNSPTTNTATPEPTPHSGPPENKLNAGLIGGISAAAVIAIAAIVFYILNVRKRQPMVTEFIMEPGKKEISDEDYEYLQSSMKVDETNQQSTPPDIIQNISSHPSPPSSSVMTASNSNGLQPTLYDTDVPLFWEPRPFVLPTDSTSSNDQSSATLSTNTRGPQTAPQVPRYSRPESTLAIASSTLPRSIPPTVQKLTRPDSIQESLQLEALPVVPRHSRPTSEHIIIDSSPQEVPVVPRHSRPDSLQSSIESSPSTIPTIPRRTRS